MATRIKVPPPITTNRTLHKGYDTIAPEKAPKEWPKCYTCGQNMLCEGEQYGPTSWAEAMAKGGHHYIRYVCPDAGTDWHNQVIGIMKQIEDTPSKSIERLLLKEKAELIKTKKATKKVFM